MSQFTMPSCPPEEMEYEKPFDEVRADEERHERRDAINWQKATSENYNGEEWQRIWNDEFPMMPSQNAIK